MIVIVYMWFAVINQDNVYVNVDLTKSCGKIIFEEQLGGQMWRGVRALHSHSPQCYF